MYRRVSILNNVGGDGDREGSGADTLSRCVKGLLPHRVLFETGTGSYSRLAQGLIRDWHEGFSATAIVPR